METDPENTVSECTRTHSILPYGFLVGTAMPQVEAGESGAPQTSIFICLDKQSRVLRSTHQ